MKQIFIIIFLFVNLICSATNYYVSATDGDDADSGLTEALAWETLTKVNAVWAAGTFAPGDNIYFNKGDSWAGTLTVGEAGTNGNNITIGAYGTGAKPIIEGAVNTPAITVTAASRGYITVDGIDLRATGVVASVASIAIYFNYWPDEMGAVPGWIIQNCTFNACILVSGPDILIKDNVFNGTGNANNEWGAIQIRGDQGDGAIVEGNTISNYADRGVWFYNGAPNVIVRNNIIHDIAVGDDQHGAGINNDGANTPNPDATIYGNTIYNCGYGISHESAIGCETYGNYVYDSDVGMTIYSYAAIYGTALNLVIHNNIIRNVGFGIAAYNSRFFSILNNTFYEGVGAETAAFVQYSSTGDANVTNLIFTNNIISGTWTYPVWNYLADAIFSQFDYNDIYSASVYRQGGANHTLAQAQAHGFMTNGITSDPLFISAGTDFHLQSESLAIDAGVDVGLTSDYSGHRIPYNLIPDMGADEYGSTYPKMSRSSGGKVMRSATGKLLRIE